MSPAERVVGRYKGASNKALSDAEFQKASVESLQALHRVRSDVEEVRENLLNMALTLKDRGYYRDASTLMDMASGVPDERVMSHLVLLLERLKHAPADTRKPAPAKPGAKPNPWTTPLK